MLYNKELFESLHLYEVIDVKVRTNKKKVKSQYSSTVSRFKKIGNEIIQIAYNTYYNKEVVDPSNTYISIAKFEKDGKTSQLNFTNIEDSTYVEKVLLESGLDWKYTKDNYYYSRHTLKGTKYSNKDYMEKLVNAGFGNEIVAINTVNKEAVWF